MSKQFINDYEFPVFAIPRSGHHAIIQWIAYHFPKPIYYLNNINKSQTDIPAIAVEDFFKNFCPTRPYRGSVKAAIANKLSKWYIKYSIKEVSQIPTRHKECLMYNFEGMDLSNIPNSKRLNRIRKQVGSSGVRRNLLVLRDPFNLIASRLAHKEDDFKNPSPLKYDEMKRIYIPMWKQYAEEFVGKTSFITDKICINYNLWFSDKDYRKDLSGKLKLTYSDKGLNQVPVYGDGSSFARGDYQLDGSKLRVLSRWEFYRNDNLYKNLFDKEVVKLSRIIFGDIVDF